MAVHGVEVGLVSTDRRLVDFLAHVFDLEELPPIEVTPEMIERLPAAAPAIQYRLQAHGTILKVTVPMTLPEPHPITEPVLAGTGLRYITLYVDDLEPVASRALQLGGRLAHPPSEFLGGVRIALIVDPDGNTYEVAEIPS
jgi:catechol 2,3-dioxygenase-like lactoylglutathione lyase family enzyme